MRLTVLPCLYGFAPRAFSLWTIYALVLLLTMPFSETIKFDAQYRLYLSMPPRIFKFIWMPEFMYGLAIYFDGLNPIYLFNPLNEKWKEVNTHCQANNINVYTYVNQILRMKGYNSSERQCVKRISISLLATTTVELTLPYVPISYYYDVKDKL